MSFPKNILSGIREAASHLRHAKSINPSAATEAIQRALRGLSPSDAKSDQADHSTESTNTRKTRSGPSIPSSFDLGGKLPDFVPDLLRQLGVGALHEPMHGPAGGKIELPPGAQFLGKSFHNAAGGREYKVYVPSSHDGTPLPVVVMLHGCTQHPDDFAAGTKMNAIAEENKCLVVYPAQSQSANHSRCWNWFSPNDQQRDSGEPSIIAGITRTVIEEHNGDPRRVYVAGLSAGGAMALIMGHTYPELYAAVGVHSGLPYASAHDLPSALAAMKGDISRRSGAAKGKAAPHTIVFHGDKDHTVHPHNGEQVLAQTVSTGNGRAKAAAQSIISSGKAPGGRRFTQTTHHDGQGEVVAEHWVIHGAGHAWSGGSSSGSYTDPTGPDAGAEMMRFFATRSQPAQSH